MVRGEGARQRAKMGDLRAKVEALRAKVERDADADDARTCCSFFRKGDFQPHQDPLEQIGG